VGQGTHVFWSAYTDSHHEQVQAITTLRSGKKFHETRKTAEERERQIVEQSIPIETSQESERAPPSETSRSYIPKASFPGALERPKIFGKQGAKIQEMLEIFKHVHINLPLLDVIQQVPAYAKFLKELCTQKRKSRSLPKKIFLTDQVSSVF
jgi:hypothetical protein